MPKRDAVLVMEYDPDVRTMLRDALEDDGYAVQLVADASTGVQVLRYSPTAMTVLVDVVPVKDWSTAHSGVELLDALRHEAGTPDEHQLGRHTFILMSTNPQQALTLARAMPQPLSVLAKPFRLDELRARVAQAVHRHAAGPRTPFAA
jgi:DNA-binding response OmpR family regulator